MAKTIRRKGTNKSRARIKGTVGGIADLTLTEYEQKALEEIRRWKTPSTSFFVKAVKVIGWPLAKAGALVLRIPSLGDAIKKAIHGIISVLSDAALWSVRPQSIFAEYREAGCNVEKLSDIAGLDLAAVDRTIGWLGAKYKGITFSEGGVAGATGVAGMVVDIPTLITINLRAIGEYATYCGFDISVQQERLFAMNVLRLASSPDDRSKVIALGELAGISADIARKTPWKELNKNAFVAAVAQIANLLGIRLTKAKLAQVIPFTGAVVGAGFNSYYTARVCDAAYYLYRERFLANRYGIEILETRGT